MIHELDAQIVAERKARFDTASALLDNAKAMFTYRRLCELEDANPSFAAAMADDIPEPKEFL